MIKKMINNIQFSCIMQNIILLIGLINIIIFIGSIICIFIQKFFPSINLTKILSLTKYIQYFVGISLISIIGLYISYIIYFILFF